eukprot:38424-Eustigmatos_ZCMA.PRE.1
MALVLLSLRPTKPQARYVLWPRIDQKSCLKAIITAGLDAVVLPLQLDGDELNTDLEVGSYCRSLFRAVLDCGPHHPPG